MREARELEAKLEVHYEPHLFRQDTILTPLQRENRQREREEEEKKTREALEVRYIPHHFWRNVADSVSGGREAQGT